MALLRPISAPLSTQTTLPTRKGKKEFQTSVSELTEYLAQKILKGGGDAFDYVLIGRLYRLRGEPKRAFKMHQGVLARPILDAKTRVAAFIECGFDLLDGRAGDFGESYFRQALTINRRNSSALRGLVTTFEFQGHYEKAVEPLTQLVRLDVTERPHLAFLFAELGQSSLSREDLGKARRYVNRALDADLACPPAHLLAADIEMASAHYEKVIEGLKEFLKTWPSLAFLALRRMEDAHYRMNAFPEYETTLRECLRDAPDNFLLHYSLARHLRKKREVRNALESLKSALELTPLHVNAMADVMEILKDRSELTTLAAHVEKFFAALKRSRRFICPNCSERFTELTWRCESCGAWNVFDVQYEHPAP